MNYEDLRKLKFLAAMKGLKVRLIVSHPATIGVATVDDNGLIAVHANSRFLDPDELGVVEPPHYTYLHSVFVDIRDMLYHWELVDAEE